MICHVRRFKKIYYDLFGLWESFFTFLVYIDSTTIIRHASLSEHFEEISPFTNVGNVQRRVCWLFDLLLLSQHNLSSESSLFSATGRVQALRALLPYRTPTPTAPGPRQAFSFLPCSPSCLFVRKADDTHWLAHAGVFALAAFDDCTLVLM